MYVHVVHVFFLLCQAVSLLIYFGLSVYFILCVHSLHMIIKIQKKSVVRFLEHEFEATEGKHFWIWMNIEQLEFSQFERVYFLSWLLPPPG